MAKVGASAAIKKKKDPTPVQTPQPVQQPVAQPAPVGRPLVTATTGPVYTPTAQVSGTPVARATVGTVQPGTRTPQEIQATRELALEDLMRRTQARAQSNIDHKLNKLNSEINKANTNSIISDREAKKRAQQVSAINALQWLADYKAYRDTGSWNDALKRSLTDRYFYVNNDLEKYGNLGASNSYWAAKSDNNPANPLNTMAAARKTLDGPQLAIDTVDDEKAADIVNTAAGLGAFGASSWTENPFTNLLAGAFGVDSTDAYTPYFMTTQQTKDYNWLLENRGKAAAEEYRKSLKPQLAQTYADWNAQEFTPQFAKEHPVLAGLVSVGESYIEPLATVENALNIASGKGIDRTSPANIASTQKQNIRTEQARNINSPVERFLYNTLMSTADYAAMMPVAGIGKLGEAVVLGHFGSSATNARARELINQGVPEAEAFGWALLSGAVEVVTEKVSLDKLVNASWKGGMKNFVKNMVTQGFTEGSEEVASDALNLALDTIRSVVSQDGIGPLEKEIQELEKKGATRGQATSQVILNHLRDTGLSFAGGALSGGIMGGGYSAFNYNNLVNVGANIVVNEDGTVNMDAVQALIERGNNMPADTISHRQAELLEQKIREGRSVTAREAAMLYANNYTAEKDMPYEELLKLRKKEADPGEWQAAKDVAMEHADELNKDVRQLYERTVEEAVTNGATGKQAIAEFDRAYTSGFNKLKAPRTAYISENTVREIMQAAQTERTGTQPRQMAASRVNAERNLDNVNNYAENGAQVYPAAVREALDNGATEEQARVAFNEVYSNVYANKPVTNTSIPLSAPTIANIREAALKDRFAAENKARADAIPVNTNAGVAISDPVIRQHVEQGRLTETVDFADEMGKLFGEKVSLVAKLPQNGQINLRTGEIVVALNTDFGGIIDRDRAMRATLGHELAHRMRQVSPKTWDKFTQAVIGSDIDRFNADVNTMIRDTYKGDITRDAAQEEVLADYIGNKFFSGDIGSLRAMVESIDSLPQRSGFIQHIVDMASWIKSKLTGQPANNAARIETEFKKMFKETQAKVREAEAAKVVPLTSEEAAQKPGNVNAERNPEIVKALEAEGVAVSADGDMFTKESRRTWDATDKKKVKQNLLKMGFTEAEVDKWINDVNSVSAIIAENTDRLDYFAAPNQKFLKANGDYYKKTLDASTLCAKRLLYQGTYDAIMHQLPNTPLLAEDVIRLRELMKDMGHEVPCGICYVESRRKALGKYASEWLAEYDGEYVPTLDQVVTSDGLETLRTEHPQTYNDFVKAMKAKGTASPKVVELRTEYREDLKSLPQTSVDYLNSIGGLRINSFSDFETPHLIDFMQAVMDMSSKGLKGMAYTKVPAFAWVFGDTGIKINLSLIVKTDANGNVVRDDNGRIMFDEREGINPEEAQRLREAYSNNVGTIAVAKDMENTLELLNDDRVDFVIPFHRSGWSKAEYMQLGLKGYSDFATGHQETGIYPSQYWDYSKTGKENAEEYLRRCAEAGITPVFEQLLEENEDGSYSLKVDGSTDNYWKLLVEGRMYNNEGVGVQQQAVKPNFNMERAMDVLNSYNGDPNRLPVATDVVDAYVKEYKEAHSDQVKFSRRSSTAMDSEGRTLTEAQAEYFKDSEIRDEDGNLQVVYHGTYEDFTVFDRNRGRSNMDIQGSFFSPWDIDAAGYGPNVQAYYLNITNPAPENVAYQALNRFKGQNNAGVKAREYLESLGYDGVNNSDEEYIAFNANQIKLVENQSPTIDPDIRYSKRASDTEYMAAVEANDKKVLERMVEEAAKEAMPNSKLIQDGKFRKMWHHTSAQFTSFLPGTTPSSGGLKGIYFTPNENSMTANLGKTHHQYYLNVENMKFAIGVEADRKYVKQLRDLQKGVTDREQLAEINRKFREDTGIDAFFDWQNGWYNVLAPELIKSADPVVYDDNGNVIPLSERFQADNPDIRYSKRTESDKNAIIRRRDAAIDRLRHEMTLTHGVEPDAKAVAKAAAELARGWNVPVNTIKAAFTDIALEYAKYRRLTNQNAAAKYIQASEQRFSEMCEELAANVAKSAKVGTVEEIKSEIMNAVFNAPVSEPTFADKLRERTASPYEKRLTKAAESKERTRLLNIMRRLDKLANKSSAQHRAEINEAIGEFDLVAKGITKRTEMKLSGLEDWVNENKENPDAIITPQILKKIERIYKRHISEITIEDVRSATRSLLELENNIRTENRVIGRNERRTTSELGEQAIKGIHEAKGVGSSALSRGMDKFLINGLMRPETEILRLVGFDKNNPLYEYMFGDELSILTGQMDSQDYQRQAHEDYFRKFLDDKAFMETITGKKARAIEITGTGKEDGQPHTVKVTPDFLMAMYMHSRNEQNLMHICEYKDADGVVHKPGGMKVPDYDLYRKGKRTEAYNEGIRLTFTRSQFENQLKGLSDKEMQFIQAAQKYYSEFSKPRINEVSEQLVGYPLAEVDNYFRIQTDSDFRGGEFEALKFDGSLESMGWTKERTNSSMPIRLIPLSEQLQKDIVDHSKYVGLAIPIRNFSKIYGISEHTYKQNDKGEWELQTPFASSVINEINRKHPSGADTNYIRDLLVDLQNPVSNMTALDKIFAGLRSKYAGSVLAFNLGVALKQAASFPTAAAEIGWGPIIKALPNFGAAMGRLAIPVSQKKLDFISKYSPLMRLRTQGMSTQELADMQRLNHKLPAVLNWIQNVDVNTVAALWKASEYYVRQNFKDLKPGSEEYYKKVGEVHTRVITKTQPNYSELQRPGLLRSKSEITKTLMMFKTQPFQNFNILYEAVGAYKAAERNYAKDASAENKATRDEARKRLAWAISSQVVSNAVFAAMQVAWDLLRRKEDPLDDEDKAVQRLNNWFKNMISSWAGMVPGGTQALEVVQKWVDDALVAMGREKYFDGKVYGFELDASIEGLNKLVDLITNLPDLGGDIFGLITDDESKEKYIRDLVKNFKGISSFLGIPANNVQNLVQSIMEWTMVNGLKYSDAEAKYLADRFLNGVDNQHPRKRYAELAIAAGEDVMQMYRDDKAFDSTTQTASEYLDSVILDQKKTAFEEEYGKKTREIYAEDTDSVNDAAFREFVAKYMETNDQNGSRTKAEVINALNATDLSEKEKEAIYGLYFTTSYDDGVAGIAKDEFANEYGGAAKQVYTDDIGSVTEEAYKQFVEKYVETNDGNGRRSQDDVLRALDATDLTEDEKKNIYGLYWDSAKYDEKAAKFEAEAETPVASVAETPAWTPLGQTRPQGTFTSEVSVGNSQAPTPISKTSTRIRYSKDEMLNVYGANEMYLDTNPLKGDRLDEFNRAYAAVTDNNDSVSQKELAAALNAMGVSLEEGEQIWAAYSQNHADKYGSGWKKTYANYYSGGSSGGSSGGGTSKSSGGGGGRSSGGGSGRSSSASTQPVVGPYPGYSSTPAIAAPTYTQPVAMPEPVATAPQTPYTGLQRHSEGGNVDLTFRPVLRAVELRRKGWGGVLSDTVRNFVKSYAGNGKALNFTPIVLDEDGKYVRTLSPTELREYAEAVLKGEREDDLNLQVGTAYEGADAMAQAEKAAAEIAQLDKDYTQTA